MPTELKLDTTEFAKALKSYMVTTRKDIVDVLNSKAGDVALRAVKLTKRADKSRMDALLKRGSNYGKTLKSGKQSKGKATRYQTFDPSGYVYAVLAYFKAHKKMPKWAFVVMPRVLLSMNFTRGNRKAMAIQYVNAKKRSIAYIATGWIMAAKFFGKPIATKVSDKGWAYHSTGQKATPGNLTAKISNFARGADQAPGIGGALAAALKEVTKDITDHVSNKMQASAKKAGLSKTP